MQNCSAHPREMIASLWRHRGLIKASAKRDVLGRYRGSAMGLLWSFFNPMLMLAAYTFVFSEVFKARWNFRRHGKDLLMSSDIAIKVENLSKYYHICEPLRDRLKQFFFATHSKGNRPPTSAVLS